MMKKTLSLLLVCVLAMGLGTQATAQKKAARKTARTTKTTTKSTASKSRGNGSFIVISKKDLNLRVYSKDSTLLAEYPCCLSKNKGNKQKKGLLTLNHSLQTIFVGSLLLTSRIAPIYLALNKLLSSQQ